MNTQKDDEQHPKMGKAELSKEIAVNSIQEKSSQIGLRIKEARGAISQKNLAELIDVHLNTMGKLERGETIPDALLLYEIGKVTETNPAWLLCGEPFEKELTGQQCASDAQTDLVFVPGYEVQASAGNGNHVNDESVSGSFAFQRSWVSRKGLNPAKLAVVTANGDSMEPTVKDGDILLVNLDVGRIQSDGIYLIERDNELYCKRLQKRFDGGVTIMSDNKRYEAQHLTAEMAEDLHITGRVIWIGGER